jgi:hypothetical protein
MHSRRPFNFSVHSGAFQCPRGEYVNTSQVSDLRMDVRLDSSSRKNSRFHSKHYLSAVHTALSMWHRGQRPTHMKTICVKRIWFAYARIVEQRRQSPLLYLCFRLCITWIMEQRCQSPLFHNPHICKPYVFNTYDSHMCRSLPLVWMLLFVESHITHRKVYENFCKSLRHRGDFGLSRASRS